MPDSNRSEVCATGPSAPIGQVIAPPYDVITPAERVHLASRHQANAVLVELPEPDLQAAWTATPWPSALFARWQDEGVLRARPLRPASTPTA